MVVHHRGILDQVLPGQADGGDVDAMLVNCQVGLDPILGVVVVETPQMGCVVKSDLAVQDAQGGWGIRLAGDDQPVIARVAQGRPPVAAAVGFADQSGGRRARDHAVPPGRRYLGAHKRTGHEDQRVVGAQRIRIGRDVVSQVSGSQSTAAKEVAHILWVQRLIPPLAAAQIDPQEFAEVAGEVCGHRCVPVDSEIVEME